MKICYLAAAGSMHTGRWIEYFSDQGHEVHLISRGPCREDYFNKARIHLLKKIDIKIPYITFFINFIINYFEIIMLIRKINPDVLHSHYVTDYGLVGALTNFHPFIISAWGSDVLIDPYKSVISNLLIKNTLNKADLITCDGKNSKNAIINLGQDENKIVIINHGVDTERFNPDQYSEELKKELGISRTKNVISIRHLMPIYNVESLIRAIPLVLKKFPDTKFIVAGSGPDEKYLNELASSLNINGNILFLGLIPHSSLPQYLASSDIYVSTSLSDGGVAISTLEAMACGLLPIVTDVGDIDDWIDDGKNGFIIPANDHQKLSEKIIYLLENSNINKEFHEKNSKIIQERANYYNEMDKMHQIYKNILVRG